jgi:phosphohistidine phosphatase
MNLFILRHAIAFSHGTPGYKDDERPLTAEGRKKFQRSVKGMKAMELSFDLILSSPLPRAKQTAEIFADALKRRRKLDFEDDLKPGGDPKNVIERINMLRPAPEGVVLVGHEPYLSQLISYLTCGDENFTMDLKKGGLCKLYTGSLKYGRCATLEWLLKPKQMVLMASK